MRVYASSVPLLRPNSPPSPVHKSVNPLALYVLAGLGIALGVWQARACAALQFGYVAGYEYAAAEFGAIALVGIGLLLLVYWRTRGIGVGLVAAGLLSCATFYGCMGVLFKLDRVAWRHEPAPFAIGPDQKASLVIYFRRGTTDAQIEEFRSSVLTGTAEQPEYLRLLPNQANGHEGVALTFTTDSNAEQLSRYIEAIENDNRVEKVYRDIAPTAIRPLPNSSATSTPSR
jgi:hypothetical protein